MSELTEVLKKFGLRSVVLALAVMTVATVSAAEIPTHQENAARLPPQDFTWDLQNGIREITSAFSINSRGAYVFVILFHIDRDADLREVNVFLGDGSYRFLSNSSDGAKHLIPGVDGSLAILNDLANQGKNVRRSANTGTVIQVKMEITRVGSTATPVLVRTVKSEGVSGYMLEARFRTLAEPTLEPGEYRLTAQALDWPSFPKGVHASLAVLPPWRY